MRSIFICLIIFILSIRSFPQWIPLVTSTNAELQDICFIDSITGLAAGSGGTIIRTSNAGTNWIIISSQTTQDIYSLCFPSLNTGYASGYTGFVIKTSNSGQFWFNVSPCGINVRSISFINLLTGITGGGGNLMCHTTDGGNSWDPRYTPTPHTVTGAHYYSASLLMVCGTDLPGAVLHRSTNSGTSWSTVMTLNNSGLNIMYSLSSVYFKDEFTGFTTGSYYFYGQTWGRVYRSTNSGNNWEIAANIGAAQANTINSVHFGDGQTGFAAGSNGVILRTTNGGANWASQPSGTSAFLTNVFMLNALTGYVCGANGLILKTTNGGVTGLDPVSHETPEEFALFQNYPNPFNSVTIIKFQVPSLSVVKIIVYNILGSEASVIVDEQLMPGTYEVEWDSGKSGQAGLSSGVYYYKLETPSFSETKKMVLIK